VKQVIAGGAALAATVPVVWDFFGYRFDAGPFVVTACATLMTRLIVSLNTNTRPRLLLDTCITCLSMLVAALWTQSNNLTLLPAAVTGIGFGALGIGIIGFAKGQIGAALKAGLKTFLTSAVAEPLKPDPIEGDPDADLLRKLD
jgi:hypothetical protein